jgi:microcystin-dependent protein
MRRLKTLAIAPILLAAGLFSVTPAAATSEPFISEIMTVSFGFCPRFWAEANGQLLPINQNQALFSLLGTQFGGNGTTNFALPDLRGRVVVGDGASPGGSGYTIGQKPGAETVTLTTNQMPAHTHSGTVKAFGTAGNTQQPVRNTVAASPGNSYTTTTPSNFMATGSLNAAVTGGGQPISIMKPSLVLRQCIAVSGIFPSRN